ncbi:MAG: Ig-like domain-containing alpha-2-macroglobulin family protein [Saccharofermentanales bacterium]
MKKKILSVVLAVAILASTGFLINKLGGLGGGGDKVLAGEYRGGFLLEPDESDSMGVLSGSTFTLISQMDYELSEVIKIFTIDGQEAPGIVSKAKNTFTITPKVPFEKNKLYTFRITRPADTDITWTFQTSAMFAIIGALPSDKTTNVPVDTGIELYFSHSEYQDPDEYFNIVPKVSGKFERHKNAYSFIPDKPLAAGTLYTVTIQKGITTTDGKTAIENDYVFAFETAPDANEQQNDYDNGYIFFNKVLSEYNTTEKPYLPINYYFSTLSSTKSASPDHTVKTVVYGYKQIDDFLEAIDKKSETPIWANYSYMTKSYADTSGLSKVLTFETELKANPATVEDRYIKMPANLPAGYYLVDCMWEDKRFQTFIQITDIGFYMTADKDSMLLWINDLITKKPLPDAKINLFKGTSSVWKTNDQGISLFDYSDSENYNKTNDSGERYFIIEAADGRTAVLRRYMNDYSYGNKYAYYDMFMPDYYSNSNDYWRYIQLDRPLYKPNDTVSFWGFIKNRYSDEQIKTVTAQISKGGYYPSYGRGSWSIFPAFTNEPVAKTTLDLSDGAFNGQLVLPYLEKGNYTLQIKSGEEIIASSSIAVDNYTKPAYKIEIEKDKKAVFWYEPVEFTVKTAFFEGTKVPGLDVKYDLSSGYVNNISAGIIATDDNGQFTTKITPGLQQNIQGDIAQGEVQAYFTAHASLPESGEITANDTLRVFANDINVNADSKIIGTSKGQIRQGQIDFKVNDIVLDRINNGTQKDYGDYLGNAIAGKAINGVIIKNRWVKYENGTYYDFINKKVMQRFDYRQTKETVAAINAVTDAKGEYKFTFTAPEISDGYYTYETTCIDKKGIEMKFSGYIGEQWGYYNNDYIVNTRYHLDGAKANYKVGSDVSLELKKGLETVPASPTLYIRSQNGIVDCIASAKSSYDFRITDVCKPNIYVRAVYFNGTTFVETSDINIAYDYSEKGIMISATTDKDFYKPGEEVVIKLAAKEKNGKSVKAIVNAGIVDEALFSFMDMTVSTLDSLYEFVSSGITASYESHINSGQDLNERSVQISESKDMSYSSVSTSSQKTGSGASFADKAAVVREKFADTALFKTVILDENGEGEIKFKLPDNITSWRVTLTGISTDLGAGSKTQTLKVTLPFFINYSFNSTYLAGDKASIGITGYGNNLRNGDSITYKVSTSSDPADVKTATGKAFERIDIPLGALTATDSFILIEAQSAKGNKDAVKHYIDVVTSYHEIDTLINYTLAAGFKIEGGMAGNTRLIFTDKGRGMYFPILQSYLWRPGNRIEQKISKNIADEMLTTYFGAENKFVENEPFKASDYQTSDGGIAILPYGPSDLDLSAKIAPLVKGLVDESKLTEYFQTVYEDEKIGGLKAAALYGLAGLRQPVLLEIGKAAKVNNASVKDTLYLCLAYCELGENPQALKLYNEKLKPLIKQSGSLKWIDNGADKDDVLTATALGLMLSVYIDPQTSESFYDYCKVNSTKDILIDIEMLSYVKNKIVKANPTTGKFTYTYMGETKEVILENGKIEFRDIPSKNIGEFKIISVTGDLALLSIFKKAPTGAESTDPNLKISRRYYDAYGSLRNASSDGQIYNFAIDDVVKVELTVDFDTKAIDGNYEITDYVPSGLKPIENTWLYGIQRTFNENWYGRINGQKISFNLYNFNNSPYFQERRKIITYYARVVSPGTYIAESPIIQGDGNLAGMNFGDRAVVVIR